VADALHQDLLPLVTQLAAFLEMPAKLAALEAEVRALRGTIANLQQAVPPVLVTIGEAAKRLGVSVSTIRRQVYAGALPVVGVGRSVRIDLSKIRPVDDAKVIELAATARSKR
jgi:excisionase family DNA binding protein